MAGIGSVDPKSARPPQDLAELHQRVLRLQDQTGQARVQILAYPIGTTTTQIRHGQNRVPKMFLATPDAASTISKAAAPDANYIYVVASVACSADIEVIF